MFRVVLALLGRVDAGSSPSSGMSNTFPAAIPLRRDRELDPAAAVAVSLFRFVFRELVPSSSESSITMGVDTPDEAWLMIREGPAIDGAPGRVWGTGAAGAALRERLPRAGAAFVTRGTGGGA